MPGDGSDSAGFGCPGRQDGASLRMRQRRIHDHIGRTFEESWMQQPIDLEAATTSFRAIRVSRFPDVQRERVLRRPGA
jgi:hypothetical protein